MTRWATGAGELHIPRSSCSDNCPLGHVRNFQVGNDRLETYTREKRKIIREKDKKEFLRVFSYL